LIQSETIDLESSETKSILSSLINLFKYQKHFEFFKILLQKGYPIKTIEFIFKRQLSFREGKGRCVNRKVR